jgi:thiamine kinase-like enzyme
MKQAMNTSDNQVWNGEDFRLVARMLSEIHHQSGVEMSSSQRDHVKYAILGVMHLTDSEKEAVISILDRLPSKSVLCHGDPNPNNILITSDGRAVVIDWMNASIGNPEADLAEFIVMIKYAILPNHLPRVISNYLDSVRESIIDSFMDEYTKLTGLAYHEVLPWIIPIAARKLSADGISDEEKRRLVQEIRQQLIDF